MGQRISNKLYAIRSNFNYFQAAVVGTVFVVVEWIL